MSGKQTRIKFTRNLNEYRVEVFVGGYRRRTLDYTTDEPGDALKMADSTET